MAGANSAVTTLQTMVVSPSPGGDALITQTLVMALGEGLLPSPGGDKVFP